MFPRVVIFNAVSVDGRIDHYPFDIGRFYGLAAFWKEDVSLAGAGTILDTNPNDDGADDIPDTRESAGPEDERPLLVIPDSRGRVKCWRRLRAFPYWRGMISLCSRSTPQRHIDYLREARVECIVAGEDHVDYRAALEELAERHGVRTVRVDSGGTLNGVLLRQGLVDEVSLLVHPGLVGGTSPRSIFRAPDLDSPDGVIPLRLMHIEQLDIDLVWLRYEVIKRG